MADQLPILNELLHTINQDTYRCAWSATEIDDLFCRRGPRAIAASGAINFSSPCADLCVLLADRLARRELISVLVLSCIERSLQPMKFQCNLELELADATHVIGFSETATHSYTGSIVPARHRHRIERRRYDPARGEVSFLEHFHGAGLDGVAELFEGYDLERDLKWHKGRNARWRFLWTRLRARAKKGPTVFPTAPRWEKSP